jgi:hypothetical protein
MDMVDCDYLLLADRVIREDNGKFGIIGVFKNIMLPQFPAVMPPWYVFTHLTNIPSEGDVSITVNIYNTENNGVVFSQTIELPKDRVAGQELDLNLQVVNAVFQKPGTYAVALSVNRQNLKVVTMLVQPVGGVTQ